MNKKGFTLVELSISLVLVCVVLFTMMNLLVSVKDFDVESREYNNNIISKEIIVKTINDDIKRNGITNIGTYNSNDKSLTLTVGGVSKTIKITNDGKTVLYYSDANAPILSETLCSTCGKYTSITPSKTGTINTNDVIKILITHLEENYNCEITYYKSN
jgi:prepilin-type N-terminal cleavage/methylation domain-containing protein